MLLAHIEVFGLATAPLKSTDRRSFSGRTVQAEALPPDVLSNLLGLAIAEFWDHDAAQHVRDRQNDDQQWLRERFAAVGEGLTDVLDELDDEQ